MLSLDRAKLAQDYERVSLAISQLSPIILISIIAIVVYHDCLVIQLTNGGNDLVSADIPKSLMLLHGQNPYSTDPWAAPYPPLLLFIVAGIIRLTSNNLLSSPTAVNLISQNIRLVGLLAYATVAITIYATLRKKGINGLEALVPASIFIALPAITVSPLYWFDSDTFGYPILALSLLLLVKGRYFSGTTLLATSAIFKIHPILAIPLVLVWLGRTRGVKAALPSAISASAILTTGLLVPLYVPGYSAAILGYNLANTGHGTTSFTMLNLPNYLLATLGFDFTQTLANQVWIATTALLLTLVLGIVWTRSKTLEPTSIILLGLLAWLIPLKQLYTHYLVWAMIPILMRGRLGQAILAAGLLQTADTMATWSFFPGTGLLPMMDSVNGFVVTTTVYLALGLVALATTLRGATGPTISRRLAGSGPSSSA